MTKLISSNEKQSGVMICGAAVSAARCRRDACTTNWPN